MNRAVNAAFILGTIIVLLFGIYVARAAEPAAHKWLLISVVNDSHSIVLMGSDLECQSAAVAMLEVATKLGFSGGVLCKEVMPGKTMKSVKPDANS